MKYNYNALTTIPCDKSGCFFAPMAENTLSDLCAEKFSAISMPIIDRTQYKFDINWLIDVDPHIIDGLYLFSNDKRDAAARWHDSVAKFYDLASNCREAKEQYGERSEEYKNALKAKKDYVEAVKSFYASLPHHIMCLAYNQDTLCCFGAMTSNFVDKKGNVHEGGRIRWADEANNKVANPTIDPMTRFYRSYGLDFWSKVWETRADYILSQRPETMNNDCFVPSMSIEEMEAMQESCEDSFSFGDDIVDF